MNDIKSTPKCFWITGLPGAGKSTFGSLLSTALINQCAVNPVRLDGDQVREAIMRQDGHYDSKSREQIAMTYSRLSKLFVLQGHTVICMTVSMFHSVRHWNRENIPGYVEVFIDTPESVLYERNQKNLYNSNSENVPGVSQAAELPTDPDYRVCNPQHFKKSVDTLLEQMR